MAAEAFIPASESKITIEKEVQQKPSLAERTTIESPGRPVGADEFEPEQKEKKSRARKKPKAPKHETRVESAKRDSILIITEKPQAALKISSALGDARKYSENNVAFYELTRGGKKIIVASAVGHLFGLTYSKGQTGWPIFKMEWVPAYEKNAFTKRYYDLLKKLSKRASEVIVATDYDVEGEVIGWNVVRFLMNTTKAKRMKFSTLTKPELEKAYENPLETLDWGQAYAGETRHYIDWLYGINLSRALMAAIKKMGAFRILSIGRIQGPALKIIVDRELEIFSFISKQYWNVVANVGDTKFFHPKDIFDKAELESFKDIKEANAETTHKKENLAPPHPFDLTTLQREAYALHRLAPSKTLAIAQKLYLDGLISYPRTSSQKIPESIGAKSILKSLEKSFLKAKRISRAAPIEGPKSDPAHPSIYPTGEIADLDGEEKKLYELIVNRFIAAFFADAELARKRVTLKAGDKIFTANGLKVINPGWAEVYPASFEENELEDFNGPVKIDNIEFIEKETQPPKRYTPASLITILEKKSLGTKTTRSLIIDTLFDRGYLEGTSIKATPLGMKLIEAMKKYSPIIIDENLTRDLEEKMEEMQQTNQNLQEKESQVMQQVERLITDISKEFKAHEMEIGKSLVEGTQELREMQKENSKIMPCPLCKQGTLVIKYSKKTSRHFAACDRYPECKATYSLPPNALIRKTDKISENGLPMMMALRKGKKPWIFEFNPNYKKEQQQNNEDNKGNQ